MRTLALALFVLLVPVHAPAQCVIAAYADAGGTQSLLDFWIENPGDTISLFVVLFTEDTVGAAAYRMRIPELGSYVFLDEIKVGPSGNGLFIVEPTGINLALTECVFGFGGTPVLAAEYVLMPIPFWDGGHLTIEANTNQGPTPVYVTCTNVVRPCQPGSALTVFPSAGEALTFGRIKSLYH